MDAYQGSEADVVILSCVRASVRAQGRAGTGASAAGGAGAGGGADRSAGGGAAAAVGFLRDHRRLNVALTRARHCLLVLGHVPTLRGSGSQTEVAQLVAHAEAAGAVVDSRSVMHDSG